MADETKTNKPDDLVKEDSPKADDKPENKEPFPEKEITIEAKTKPASKHIITIKTIFARIGNFFHEVKTNPKKRLIFIISLGVTLILIFGTGLYLLLNEPKSTTSGNTSNEHQASIQEAEATYQAPLDGVMTDLDSSNRHPLAIIVENHTDARPQSGLNKASVVYEAVAEGGITRFMAIFGTNQADKVGPVRSARTFFVDYAHGYNAYFAHVGGSIDGLDKIYSDKILDLDQSSNSAPFWREQTSGLASEHTVYTSTSKLYEQASKNGYTSANNFNVYKFKDEPTETEKAALPESQKVSVNYSNSSYDVYFQYDKSINSYKRFLAGKSHIDAVSKDQINPKNVVVMTVANRIITNRYNKEVSQMTTVGTGKAKIFFDGKTISGTWKKASSADREMFYDEAGNEVIFNRGQFWISIVPADSSVSVE